MLQPIRWIVWAILRCLLWCRYRVRTTGIAQAKRQPGPYLILPSHPAYADPPNVIAQLWPAFQMRPMLLETNFASPLLAPFAWLLRAIKVPDLDRASGEARQRAEQAVAACIAALKAGDNVVLWPGGTLSRDGTDKLGAARTAADVLAAVPEATAVLVRTRGLWGSAFSWARGGKPRLMKQLVRGMKTLTLNLGVFAPRRPVTMTLEAFPAAARPEPTRDKINAWLEAWYGQVPDPPTFTPYHFLFGPRSFDFPPALAATTLDASKVKPETRAAVAHVVEEKLKRPLTPAEDVADTTLASLGLDSLEGMEVALAVEQQFGFAGDAVPTTLGQLWALASGLLDKGPPKPPPPLWFRPPSDARPMEILGETLPAAFVERCLRHPQDVAAADDLAGCLTYERLLVGATVLSRRFRELPGEHVGLMLPAAVGAEVAFFGLHLAGKIPVLLNWTTGPAAMTHAVKLTGCTHVVTSKAFIDRTQLAVPGVELVLLEKVRGTIGKVELLTTLFRQRFFPGAARRRLLLGVPADPHRAAAVLFTSGSEKAPKAVPLTHANMIADMRGATPPQELVRADAILSFLPMFHSFGLTIASLFPVLGGVKVVFHPDPTDAANLARKLAGYKPTLVCGTPTFAAAILSRLAPGELDSLRLLIVGAERCPDEVFDTVARLNPRATVLEGFGVTECSPCVSVNPVAKVKRGTVGPPLPGVEVCVADLETEELLPNGQRGMLLVAGPTVFPGYLGHEGPPPFREWNGKRWYVTGDLAELDADGYIVFHGRLKRFLKAAGEMISLPALEEPFAVLHPPTEDGPQVAVEGVELPNGGRRVVLFAVPDISLKDANAVLVKEGFRGVMRLDEVRRVERIPVLGTGKTDYKILRQEI